MGRGGTECRRMRLSNWGNYPRAWVEVCRPTSVEALRQEVVRSDRLIARGNGRCYGDAALGPKVVSTLAFRRVLDWDAQRGVLWVEAGALLADLMEQLVPQGWFFHVTPGTRYVTVGGAIACDVHGKNHPHKGCFSRWVLDFDLLRADGSVVRCSREEHADLFWQTCGGMGWTGIILSARLQLMPIASVFLQQRTLKVPDLEHLLDAFESHCTWSYAVAWLDGLAQGRHLGRGVLLLAEHLQELSDRPLAFPRRPVLNIPLYAPPFLLNPLLAQAYNQYYYRCAVVGERRVDLEQCFYPLDRLRYWNRLYGRRGLVQYQFCLPPAQCLDGFRRVLECVQRSGEPPFLCVVKRHGARPAEAVNSFPERGYSLAMDFACTPGALRLVRQLDELVWQRGGKIYLAKDACSAPHMGRLSPHLFKEDKFWSHLRARIQTAQVV